ncbi:MAG: cytochrome C [Candidatus Thiodiazotropha sp. (ex Epidulcina cf. delphinae)]|nr:cytochrome C [Candidatus Thiodiazotropha sp. (ex Epidulcina cf. delphinae)]
MAGVVCGFAALSASAGTIVGSAHDLQTLLGITEICVVCHTPHNAQADEEAPLWNHETTIATFTMYSSGSLDGAISATPTAASKMCLSCHDGTVAVDAYGLSIGAGTPAQQLTGNVNLTADLSNDHPISITYDNVADTGLVDPSTTVTVGDAAQGDQISGTIADLMLPGGQVQCNSCHDVHNVRAMPGTKLLRVSNVNSALCTTCHDK